MAHPFERAVESYPINNGESYTPGDLLVLHNGTIVRLQHISQKGGEGGPYIFSVQPDGHFFAPCEHVELCEIIGHYHPPLS